MKKFICATLGAIAVSGTLADTTHAQAEGAFVGDVIMMAGRWCPAGWLEANGQALPIDQYQDLFGFMGTEYGGDGTTTFNLPDLRGRIPVHYGSGRQGNVGFPPLVVGQTLGAEHVELNESHLPSHTHEVFGNALGTDVVSPEGASFSNFTTAGAVGYQTPPDTPMDDDTVGYTGDSSPVELISPTLAMYYCVNTDGTVPQRN